MQASKAHNKIKIMGKKEVIKGSVNFTKAAQMHNAENVTVNPISL